MELTRTNLTKSPFDNPLKELLRAMEQQNDVLARARNRYLSKEAERKHFEAVLTRKAEGKSIAEKRVNAEAMPEWFEFHKELARLEAIFEFQKLKWEILDKEYQATYLGLKMDHSTMKRFSE